MFSLFASCLMGRWDDVARDKHTFMRFKCILYRAQTYRLGFLRRKGRFVNRFLRILEGRFLASGILCCNFVFEIRRDGAEGSAQAGGYKSTG